MFKGKRILVTGGTGSFGQKFTRRLLDEYEFERLIIFSRDEFKQYTMKNELIKEYGEEKIKKLRFFIGDVKDKDRLQRAFYAVDYVIHAAAMKHVPICEYNPFEAIKTNIHGAQNVIDAALDQKVKKVVALSTDKAVNPINLYGGTKLVSDKLFVAANAYTASKETVFSIVRYGNVAGSRGSVIPLFKKIINEGVKSLPITDMRMTRFWITLDEGVDLVIKALKDSKGGETYISKIPSFNITDLARAIGGEEIELEEIGIREGEKLHEIMVTTDDSSHTYEYEKHYIIYPQYDWWNVEDYYEVGGKIVQPGFEYNSGTNKEWLSVEELKQLLEQL
ncbi:UDP-N-acetylglucosamine 4,6-dehydratase (inverting) [Cellulosilyticum sp. ST5]|uniref:UDP-N-acetylglucosamine 4,6-dehydratase (inverting) n=1 Tax=unclassified Cellulosilyticum TaxID=2643091 RepID=UPI000F8DC44D|nr:UDP-N-acetylglucosamine 4,6-dehydratase (inverting) [Cellulosilyticum sp. WCF-2]QEH70812.1 UDP-N-acetylglucosamine 4,6-dehydratase (inverting) [Cellulosilyticum sp. WCF-2]